jgi:tagatose 1,6-diphosphate aldolase GatY/KbaY
VHRLGGIVEAELGRLTGTEDGLTIPEREAKLTDPGEAADFIAQTGVDALALSIGNVHGRYAGEPRLDFERLDAINKTVSVPLVLHGASGLPESMIRRSVELGITKFNVNTEVRVAYVTALQELIKAVDSPDLLDLMQSAVAAMQPVVSAKLQLFGSAGKTWQ